MCCTNIPQRFESVTLSTAEVSMSLYLETINQQQVWIKEVQYLKKHSANLHCKDWNPRTNQIILHNTLSCNYIPTYQD